MFKVSPQINQAHLPLSSASSTGAESYTIWMKSLLFNGCGCTIFNSNGEIVYRIDNYNKKCGSQVHLMNLHGEVLLLLRRKRFRVFEEWEGFRWSVRGEVGRQKPWFNVRRDCKILKRSMTTCHVSFGCDHKLREDGYRIIGFPGKSELKIIRGENQLVAEVKRKQSSASGVTLGEDVLSLEVEALPHVNHLLIMALVIVYGLIEDKL
ncbi:hypothetical protein ACET3Z_008506 [Daucus carota]